jgi:hypothetical protein
MKFAPLLLLLLAACAAPSPGQNVSEAAEAETIDQELSGRETENLVGLEQ